MRDWTPKRREGMREILEAVKAPMQREETKEVLRLILTDSEGTVLDIVELTRSEFVNAQSNTQLAWILLNDLDLPR